MRYSVVMSNDIIQALQETAYIGRKPFKNTGKKEKIMLISIFFPKKFLNSLPHNLDLS